MEKRVIIVLAFFVFVFLFVSSCASAAYADCTYASGDGSWIRQSYLAGGATTWNLLGCPTGPETMLPPHPASGSGYDGRYTYQAFEKGGWCISWNWSKPTNYVYSNFIIKPCINVYNDRTGPYVCVDTDANATYSDGKNYFQTGSASFPNGAILSDYCSNNTALLEAICASGSNASYTTRTCQYGCLNGACKSSAPTCSDSDGGINSTVKGTVTSGNGNSYTDSCTNSTMLDEASCSGANVYISHINCPYGCSNDICVNQVISCSDSDEGVDFDNSGIVTWLGNEYADSCVPSGTNAYLLNESYCNVTSGSLAWTTYNCPENCTSGTCTSWSSSDSSMLSLIVKSCRNASCVTSSRIFTLGEKVYLKYESNNQSASVDATLKFPNGTIISLFNSSYSFSASAIGSYLLNVSASINDSDLVRTTWAFNVTNSGSSVIILCNSDGNCGIGEDKENCPSDCTGEQTGSDNEDNVVNTAARDDESNNVDSTEKSVFSKIIPYLIIGIIIILIIIVAFIIYRNRKNKNDENLDLPPSLMMGAPPSNPPSMPQQGRPANMPSRPPVMRPANPAFGQIRRF